MNNKDLSKIVEKFRENPDKNFDVLYRSVYKTIYVMTYSYMKSKEDAEDLTQEIFIKIYNNIDSLKNVKAFNSWMNTIVVNSCYRALNMKKKELRDVSIDDDDYFVEHKNENIEELPEIILEVNESNKKIVRAIGDLPRIISEVIMMYYFQGLKVKQISSILKVEEATVKSRLFQGRKKLKLVLKDVYSGHTRLSGFLGFGSLGKVINDSFIETSVVNGTVVSPSGNSSVGSAGASASTGVVVGGVVAVGVIATTLVLGGTLFFNRSNDASSDNASSNNQVISNNNISDDDNLDIEDSNDDIDDVASLDNSVGEESKSSNSISNSSTNTSSNNDNIHQVVDDNKEEPGDGGTDTEDPDGGGTDTEEPDGGGTDVEEPEEEIELSYDVLMRAIGEDLFSLLTINETLTQEELDWILDLPSVELNPDFGTTSLWMYQILIWDQVFQFRYAQVGLDEYIFGYQLIVVDNIDSKLNIDTNSDGVIDLNIDLDGDGLPDLNIDLDDDGLPDLNIDVDNDGYPENNVDLDGDWIPDTNIV